MGLLDWFRDPVGPSEPVATIQFSGRTGGVEWSDSPADVFWDGSRYVTLDGEDVTELVVQDLGPAAANGPHWL